MTDIEKVKSLFNKALSDKKPLIALPQYDEKKSMVVNNFFIYSFQALPELIEKMKQLDGWSLENQYQARFVIEDDGSVWFAQEGRPGDRVEYLPGFRQELPKEQVPSHEAMIRPGKTCIGAGIVCFDKEYHIFKITNFSGHFRPNCASLLWIVGALVTLNARFAPQVDLGFFWKRPGALLESKTVSCSVAQLAELLPDGFSITPQEYAIYAHSNGDWISRDRDAPQSLLNKRGRDALSGFGIFGIDGSLLKRSRPTSSSSFVPSMLPVASSYSTPPSSPKRDLTVNEQSNPFSDVDTDVEDENLAIAFSVK